MKKKVRLPEVAEYQSAEGVVEYYVCVLFPACGEKVV